MFMKKNQTPDRRSICGHILKQGNYGRVRERHPEK